MYAASYQLLQGGIPSALPDAVDSALQLPGPRLGGGEHVCNRHAQVVVAVHRDRHIIHSIYVLPQRANELVELHWSGVTHCIGHIDCSGSE